MKTAHESQTGANVLSFEGKVLLFSILTVHGAEMQKNPGDCHVTKQLP